MSDRMNPVQNTPLPALPAPPGFQARGGGSSGVPDREDGLTLEARLSGTGTVPVILAHYESQFTRAGWRRVDQVLSGSLGASTFDITVKRVTWLCALVVTVPASDAAQVHLALRMR